MAGIFPEDWISPQGLLLYSSKQRKISAIDNYRPLSVIFIIGKVFERIIYYQLFANLSDHNILSAPIWNPCAPFCSYNR